MKKLLWFLAFGAYIALFAHDGQSQTRAPVLTAAKMSGTVSKDMKTITFNALPAPIQIVKTTSTYSTMFFLSATNKIRVAGRATYSCGNCITDTNPTTMTGEVLLGGASAYPDLTWHNFYNASVKNPNYLTWTFDDAPSHDAIDCHTVDCNMRILPVVAGYNVWRSLISGGPYKYRAGKFDTGPPYYSSPGPLFSFDASLMPGQKGYYVVAAYDPTGKEFATSNEVMIQR